MKPTRSEVVKRVGAIAPATLSATLAALGDIFAE